MGAYPCPETNHAGWTGSPQVRHETPERRDKLDEIAIRKLGNPMTTDTARRYLSATLLALGVTLVLVLLRDALTDPNVSLVYIVVVLVVAIRQGTGPSLLIALITFLGF